MESKDESKLCIVIIPKTQKVKRIVIPDWLPKVTLISIIAICAVVFVSYDKISTSTTHLQEQYNDKTSIVYNLQKKITNLEEIGKNKNLELADLEANAVNIQQKIDEVDIKLKEIETLQKKLEKKAGLKTASRGSSLNQNINIDTSEPEEGLETLKEILDEKQNELETFIGEIQNRFQYLESVPNLWPAPGRFSSGFGYRRNPFGRGVKFHKGIDIANSRGTNIKAAGSGVVTFAGNRSGYGKVVIIKHNSEYETLYAHNQKILVTVGDKVKKGQVVAKMGTTGRSTGCHLHFEVHKNGKTINPLKVVKK